MTHNLVVPALGESVNEAIVARWAKSVGDTFSRDEVLVELETDKVTLEVPAPHDGELLEIMAQDGVKVKVGQVLGVIHEVEVASPPALVFPSAPEIKPEPEAVAEAKPVSVFTRSLSSSNIEPLLSPSVRKIVTEHGLEPTEISGTGKDGRLTKEDVMSYIVSEDATAEPQSVEPSPVTTPTASPQPVSVESQDLEERVKMTRLRQTIAQRLKDAQNTAAMLTTFNEIDMSEIIAVRQRLKDRFASKHGIKLGFMSFFVKACNVALQEIPAVNATIEGDEIVYKKYCHIGVAVGAEQGLVVPVVRDVQAKSFADIELEIGALATKAREGKLAVSDLSGGTFTITNGGVYGSLMSTPILNPPQAGILGMHKIEKRPVVVDDQVVIRPMMYLALTYDHRIIDGREAVSFLVRVKECLEDPQRILLAI